ncbi:MAG: ATP-binding protein [Acidobacteria bacterium]|nr:ATP-binding protein [Acidobacteriota bacterium]
MDIIHSVNRFTLPRILRAALQNRLDIMPAVVVTGARQTGKSTLARELLSNDRRYYTFDDLDVRDAARRDPTLLTGGSRPITLDEVQREPGIMVAIKRAIDEDRRPGRFLLTGSANLLLMGKVSESLAGRASYLTLWPMTRREQLGLGQCGIWDELVTTPPGDWMSVISDQSAPSENWQDLALRGGFPTPAIELNSADARRIWFDGYVRTYLERDLQDISAIEALPDFRRLMRAACHRLGAMVNQTELGRDVALPQATVHRYLNLLETSYLLFRLPAFAANRTKRLVKSPKLYWGDTGIALHLAERDPGGEHFENLVLNDLLAWRDSRNGHADLFYWRTQIGEEVDFVIETNGKLLPIEVKSTKRPGLSDIGNLRVFRSEYPEKTLPGLLLHGGTTVEWIAPDVLAAPWWKII